MAIFYANGLLGFDFCDVKTPIVCRDNGNLSMVSNVVLVICHSSMDKYNANCFLTSVRIIWYLALTIQIYVTLR